jgi:hypothetical protein
MWLLCKRIIKLLYKENKNMSLINTANDYINNYKDNTKLNANILKKYLKPLNLQTKLRQHLLKSK